ncbi:unnamed protein product [Nippostrongylus brasiliensis]|uniref:Secreted protein n=1 Tax=Nippostrongylus brasiliensis TaxID=27835 RepID=A0A0N4XNL1_NIPBR|nr:unnamed protein product [Nippostrongylus brasiliensis]
MQVFLVAPCSRHRCCVGCVSLHDAVALICVVSDITIKMQNENSSGFIRNILGWCICKFVPFFQATRWTQHPKDNYLYFQKVFQLFVRFQIFIIFMAYKVKIENA